MTQEEQLVELAASRLGIGSAELEVLQTQEQVGTLPEKYAQYRLPLVDCLILMARQKQSEELAELLCLLDLIRVRRSFLISETDELIRELRELVKRMEVK